MLQWTPDRPRSIATLNAHLSCVYQALFSPHQPDILATCSTDGTLKIFDLRSQSYATSGPGTNNFTHPLSAAALTVPASGTEILSLDWNKYRPFVLASAGVDKAVKIWDCRMIKIGPDAGQGVGGICEVQLPGHEYAVRKVQWSPHRPDVLATASYDMTCRVQVLRDFTALFILNVLLVYTGGPQILPQADHIYFTFMIRTQSLLWVAVGLCMMKAFWQAVVGTVNLMYFVCKLSIPKDLWREPDVVSTTHSPSISCLSHFQMVTLILRTSYQRPYERSMNMNLYRTRPQGRISYTPSKRCHRRSQVL
jgi:WD40 repeat protein